MSAAEEAWSFVLASNGMDAEVIEQFTTQARNHLELQAAFKGSMGEPPGKAGHEAAAAKKGEAHDVPYNVAAENPPDNTRAWSAGRKSGASSEHPSGQTIAACRVRDEAWT